MKIINKIGNENEIINLKGNIFVLFKNAIKIIKDRVDFIVIDGIVEAVSNAMIHRDYFDVTREIVIYLSEKKIIISNPGAPIGNIKVNNIIKEENHKRRNFWLYKAFLVLDDENYLLENNNGLKYILDCYEDVARVRFLTSRELNVFKIVIDKIKLSSD
jgi:predicted HTH transcriptional regulator